MKKRGPVHESFAESLPIGQHLRAGTSFGRQYHCVRRVVARAPQMFEYFRSVYLHEICPGMVAHQHYQRLKHLYAVESTDHVTGPVDISYGYAKVVGVIEEDAHHSPLNRVPHQQLLTDVASLAAGSVEKEGQLSLEHFNLSVHQPDYQGSVQATAEVVLAEPPRYHVRATLFGDDGERLADALAFFEPSGKDLPPDPAPEAEEEGAVPPPAPFMPVHVTPYGPLCLN